LICILGTGSGKTGLIIIPEVMEDNAEKMTTIVIVPTVELAADIVRTCTNKNVDCIRYDRACTFMHAPTVVVVIADISKTGNE
jgi:superfamily II DNA/RNA helicase